ncbi:hypothetical protein D1872_271560 [compost metagenome]
MIEGKVQVQYLFYGKKLHLAGVVIGLPAGQLMLGDNRVVRVGNNPSPRIPPRRIVDAEMLEMDVLHPGFFLQLPRRRLEGGFRVGYKAPGQRPFARLDVRPPFAVGHTALDQHDVQVHDRRLKHVRFRRQDGKHRDIRRISIGGDVLFHVILLHRLLVRHGESSLLSSAFNN